ncbi:ATP-binding protein [Micromonospora haikouensis]|uniref:ATP-binding protein n=1 Tax=Micromonospora haikouensis TaxID=686309 RepID=UPI00114CAD83|nr:ATP-binding protein [Micromonospora haikouensis]
MIEPLFHLFAHHIFGWTGLGRYVPGWWNFCRASGQPGDTADPARAACTSITGFLSPVSSIALTLFVFYLFTRFHVRRWYRRRAETRPYELVQTANDDIDQVVGRRELCEVLIERIRDDRVRCPTIIVGGVGSGKTATLVALTRQLARRGILPIPIRLHDAQDKNHLDFEQMARDRFLQEINARLYSDSQGARLWRMLRWGNRLAVLADGLEETTKADKSRSGESVIRAAIEKAADDHLPLVIASRPYDPLRGMPAIIVAVESLGEGAALDYALTSKDRSHPAAWAPVIDMVLAADVTESPLFLRIIRDLNQQGRLRYRTGYQSDPDVVSRPVDRYAARWELLSAWRDALLDGYLREDFARDRREREDTLLVISAFACAGFLRDSLQVTYDDLTDHGHWADPKSRNRPLFDLLSRKLTGEWDLRERDTLAHAATEGSQLGLVDAQSDGIRFQHGDIQAYLGGRLLADPELRSWLLPLLVTGSPSREGLTAMRLLSRCLEHDRSTHKPLLTRPSALRAVWSNTRSRTDDAADMVQRLWQEAPPPPQAQPLLATGVLRRSPGDRHECLPAPALPTGQGTGPQMAAVSARRPRPPARRGQAGGGAAHRGGSPAGDRPTQTLGDRPTSPITRAALRGPLRAGRRGTIVPSAVGCSPGAGARRSGCQCFPAPV